MRIKNKFKIGDIVYFLFNNWIASGIIKRILIDKTETYEEIKYEIESTALINKDTYGKRYYQDKCFATKEELKSALK